MKKYISIIICVILCTVLLTSCSCSFGGFSSESFGDSDITAVFGEVTDGITSAFGGTSEDAHETKEAALTQSEIKTLCDIAVFDRIINNYGTVTKQSVMEALSVYFWQNDDLKEATANRNFEDGYLVSLNIKAEDLNEYVSSVFGVDIPSLYEQGSFAGDSIVCDGETYTFYLTDANYSCEMVSAMEYSDSTILVATESYALDEKIDGSYMEMRVKKTDSPVGFSVVR